jgi:hypothetical protein
MGRSHETARVCRLQLLLVLASAVILGSESRGTRDHILLSQIRDFPFCRLLRLAGLRWRYSTLPPHGMISKSGSLLPLALITARRPAIKDTTSRRYVSSAPVGCHGNGVFSNLLPDNDAYTAIRCNGN